MGGGGSGSGLSTDVKLAWKNYQSYGYIAINKYLRKGEVGYIDSKEDIEAKIDSMEEGLHESEMDQTLFRGASNHYDNVEIGDIITDPGFMSTSTDISVAIGKGSSGITETTILQIDAPAGTLGFDMNQQLGTSTTFASEKEFTLPAGTDTKVIDITRQENPASFNPNAYLRVVHLEIL